MQIYVKISLRSENICSKIWLYILSEGKVSSDICFTFLLSICVFVLILFFFSGKYVAVFTFSRDFISHLFHFCVHILIFRFFEIFFFSLLVRSSGEGSPIYLLFLTCDQRPGSQRKHWFVFSFCLLSASTFCFDLFPVLSFLFSLVQTAANLGADQHPWEREKTLMIFFRRPHFSRLKKKTIQS